MEDMIQEIKEKAYKLGYEKCGIIKVEAMADYSNKLEERISQIPMGEMQYQGLRKYANPQKQHEWAKSIIILVRNYSIFNVPEGIQGLYGKNYVFDERLDEASDGYKAREEFRVFLEGLGLQAATESKYGLTASRWAAYNAGLGIIRKNNFFYTENGSWVMIETWLIDKEMELIEKSKLKPCPENCRKCIAACPTKSLSRPYTMSPVRCVSFLNSKSQGNNKIIPSDEDCEKIGGWLYGCDACQDVCLFNKGKWKGGNNFPGLDEITDKMMPQKITSMQYSELGKILAPKFWYIETKDLWKWKINAITVMANRYTEKYSDFIKFGLKDTNEIVRAFAQKTCEKLGI